MALILFIGSDFLISLMESDDLKYKIQVQKNDSVCHYYCAIFKKYICSVWISTNPVYRCFSVPL